MIDRRIRLHLDPVAARYRRLRLFTTLAIVWAAVAASGIVCLLLNWGASWYSPWTIPLLLAVAAFVPAWKIWQLRRSADELQEVARRIEAEYPELDARLLTAIEQDPGVHHGRLGYLQENVIRETLHHAGMHYWEQAISSRRLLWSWAGSLASLVVLASVMNGLMSAGVPRSAQQRAFDEDIQMTAANVDYQVTIEPGDTEIERGTSLLVTARFIGPLPSNVALKYEYVAGDSSQLPMSKSLDDPLFAARIPGVDREMTYRVEFGGRQSGEFHVQVFEYPALKGADAELVFPEYTSMTPRTLEDVRRLTAPVGTQLTLTFHLNKPVAEGCLTSTDDEAGEQILLVPAEEVSDVYVARMTLERTRRFKLHLLDDRGRANRFPPEFVINVTPNRPPDLKLTQPTRDVQVSPLEEFRVKANVWDDFGLSSFGVTFSLAGHSSTDVVLGQSAAGKERHPIEHLIAFETLDAEPNQLLSYHFWAEDVGVDGRPRRTFSDMYFAEVRHFEEIFREGQQPPGGSQQQQGENGNNARDADELAEIQKQIINATWKLIRRETGEQPTERFTEDVELLKESQTSVLDRAARLAQNVRDFESKQYVLAVQQHMMKAIEHLAEAVDEPSVEALSPALAAEQSAYQAVLKLRAREHLVMRNSQQGQQQNSSARNSSSRFQQQLQQLELENSENRYETERTAARQQQENEADREDRQVLNRLRELARRQSDLNERMKELQSQLQAAQTDREREEIRRQLKRLQDEEQQLLRDTDELTNRMDQPRNQERMSDTRQQLEETRENIRRASQALEEGMVTRAAASGTRAERELEEMRDEFRKQTSRQFEDEMREMRDDARQLAENERQVAEKLEELRQPQSKSLRSSGDRTAVREEIGKQRQKLDELLDRMQNTVQEADENEPLLAKRLYDTLREARQSSLKDALESTEQLLRQGFLDDAQQTERLARQEIEKLQQGIERAAGSVLGDETESLRRALDEVEELREQLDQEIARADPREETNEPQRRGRDSEQQRGEAEPDAEDQPPGVAPRPQAEESDDSADGRQGTSRPQNQDGGQTPQRGATQPGEPQQSRDTQSPTSSDAPRGDQRTQQRIREYGLGGFERYFEEDDGLFAPLTGDDFRAWSDRLRDVEELVDDPELRGEAARIRERARAVRIDLKRHSRKPDWEKVRLSIAQPLMELQLRLSEELLRRQSQDALVPIDRDPVPPRFTEQVRRYYERLGSGQ